MMNYSVDHTNLTLMYSVLKRERSAFNELQTCSLRHVVVIKLLDSCPKCTWEVHNNFPHFPIPTLTTFPLACTCHEHLSVHHSSPSPALVASLLRIRVAKIEGCRGRRAYWMSSCRQRDGFCPPICKEASTIEILLQNRVSMINSCTRKCRGKQLKPSTQTHCHRNRFGNS